MIVCNIGKALYIFSKYYQVQQVLNFHATDNFGQMHCTLDKLQDAPRVLQPHHTLYELHMRFCNKGEDLQS